MNAAAIYVSRGLAHLRLDRDAAGSLGVHGTEITEPQLVIIAIAIMEPLFSD